MPQQINSPDNSTDGPGTPTATPLAWSPVLRRLGAAFTFPKYRNVWLAAFTSATGTWVQRFAQQVLIFNLTQSAFMLALNTVFADNPTFAYVAPVFLWLMVLLGFEVWATVRTKWVKSAQRSAAKRRRRL